MASKEISQQ